MDNWAKAILSHGVSVCLYVCMPISMQYCVCTTFVCLHMCVHLCVCVHVHLSRVYIQYKYHIIYSGEPSKVDLPGPASQIACGDNHTVVLLASGEIYTFGKHKVRNSSPNVYIPPPCIKI